MNTITTANASTWINHQGTYTVPDTFTVPIIPPIPPIPPTLITTGTGATWANPTQQNKLTVMGDAEFEGDLKIKGKSLSNILESIEERLAILHPNPKLEDKWDELKELSKRYKELEAEIIEKEKVWAILKK